MTFTNTDCVNFKVHGEKPTLYKVNELGISVGTVWRYPSSQYWATLCNVDTLDEERVFQQVHRVNHILQYAVKNKICEEIDK